MQIGPGSYGVAIYQPHNGYNGTCIPTTNVRDSPFVKHISEDKLMSGMFSLTKTQCLTGRVLKDLNVLWNQK